MSEPLYPNNLVTIKRVNNGYYVSKENTTEFDDEGEDGTFIYSDLPALIAALAATYSSVEED